MSAINFDVNSDIIQRLEPALRALGPHQFSRAVKAASKRAATTASNLARKEIPTQWTIKKQSIKRDAIKVRNPGSAFEIYSRGSRLSSPLFSTTPPRGSDTTGNKRTPIYLQCEVGKPKVFVPASWLWNAHGGLHLARYKNGKTGPHGGKYMDIRGPAVPQMLASESVREPVVDAMVETFEKRLRHEYEYRLSQATGGR